MAGFNLFNTFGSIFPGSGQTQPQQQQYALGSQQPQLAGQNDWVLEQIKRRKQLLDTYGVEKGDWFGSAMAQQSINQILENDPAKQEQQLRMYENTMNRLADAANERAMKGHIFAGLINLPNKWQEAMAEKYRYTQPNMFFTSQALQGGSPFVTRQYINI